VNLVDSSGWLEYFADGPGAGFFAPAIEQTSRLLVPTVVLYEVSRRLMVQRGERVALEAVAAMRQGTVVELTADLATAGAQLGGQQQLPLADSIIYATARARGATLWTQDADFEGLAGVRYRAPCSE
jgi:predicted nucleic acid-binding protein